MINKTIFSLISLCLFYSYAIETKELVDNSERVIFDASEKRINFNSIIDQQNFVSGTKTSAQFPKEAEWIWQDLGNNIGQNVLAAIDIDADDEMELVLSTNGQGFGDARSVLILSSDLVTVECSLDINGTPVDFHVSQMDDDSALELTIVSLLGIKTFDGETCKKQLDYEFENSISAVGIGDVNNDNIPDVAYSYNGHLFVSAINEMGSPIQRLGFGGSKIIIEPLGRVGGDDIGTYNQTHTVLNGENLTTLTEIFDLDPRYFSFGDVNGDGSFEVVSIQNSSIRTLIAINVNTGSVVSEFAIDWPDVLVTQDVNNDGKDDFLLGNNQWGDVVVYDYTGNDIFRVGNPEHGVSNLTVTDIDKDGNKEMLFGAGHSSSGSDHLFKADWQSQSISWQSEDFDGPFQLSKGFININGRKQIAVSVSETNSSYDVGGSFFLDTNNGSRSPLFQPVATSWGHVNAIDVGNPEGPNNPFLCHTGDYTYDEYLSCFDAESGAELWRRDAQNGYINYMKMMDVDNDQSLDILVINGNGKLGVYQATNGFLKWQSEIAINSNSYRGFKDVYLINGELWVLAAGDLYKFNPNTGESIETVLGSGLSGIDFVNGTLYGARTNEGFGVINLVDYSIVQMIYPEIQTITYLNVSEDGKVAYISTGLSSFGRATPDMDVTLVSIEDDFEPWYVGEINVYDTNFPDQFTLYISNQNSVRKFDLTLLNEDIFDNGFE